MKTMRKSPLQTVRLNFLPASRALSSEAPIRSLFFAKQGCSADSIAAAAADAVVLDLEDSVPTAGRSAARAWVAGVLEEGLGARCRVFVRINGPDDPEAMEADLEACVRPGLHGLVLPMLQSASDVQLMECAVERRETKGWVVPGALRFVCLLETPAAILAAAEIAAASTRTIALSFGHADFLRGIRGASGPESLLTAQCTVVMAARAQGLQAIASPFLNFSHDRAFARECRRMKGLGFSGIYTLHPRQNATAGAAFSPSPQELNRARRIMAAVNGGGVAMLDGAMVGPPMATWAREIMAQNGDSEEADRCADVSALESRSGVHEDGLCGGSSRAVVSAEPPRYGVDLERLHPGQVLESPYELTIDEGWRATWQTSFHASSRLETSDAYARTCGLAARPLPFSLLLNLTLCMSVEPFSESCRLHLGLHDVQAERPAYAGDTFRNLIRVTSVRNTSRGDASVIRTVHVLLNQRGERVFSLTKLSYFDPVAESCTGEAAAAPADSPFVDAASLPLREQLLRAGAPPEAPTAPLAAGTLLLHPPVRPIGWSENLALTTLLRNTHPVHFDAQRFDREDIIVCGGFVQSLAQAACERELKQVLHETIVHSSHVNTVAPEDRIGAISYVRSVTPVGDHLEEVVIKTLGLRNVDVRRELAGRELPLELFTESKLKPSQYEELCRAHCPELSGRIALQMERRILRPRS
ncbi:MAG: aldolase/citrate lyase family protein [Candidatus Krumholzibacteria bacterium]|nr:aldolase/citrate lyase family protein [Candidatus Krumholzibacteria bacterium]